MTAKIVTEYFINYHNNSLQTVTEFKDQLEGTLRSAIFTQRLVQALQIAYIWKTYSPSLYNVDDEVHQRKKLCTDSLCSVSPVQKLSDRRKGELQNVKISNKNAVQIMFLCNVLTKLVIHIVYTPQENFRILFSSERKKHVDI